MSGFKKSVFLYLSFFLSSVLCWENLPQLPTGRRSQYYLQHDDGAYKYGFDTGGGFFAKQSADSQNQVEGHFKYPGAHGKDIDIKYTSGIQGYVPSGLEALHAELKAAPILIPSAVPYSHPQHSDSGDETPSGDASYSFTIDTDSYKRQEASDATGNIKGSYSYSNKAGHHDLSYIAGSGTGFVATSGSLSIPNGLGDIGPSGRAGPASSLPPSSYSAPPSGDPSQIQSSAADDGSYSFSYNTGDSSRQESSDSAGNVKGRYSFTNKAGSHDLNYIAGSATGFVATSGSLSVPNGLGDIGPSGRAAASSPVVPGAGYLPPASAVPYSAPSDDSQDDQANTGDASYSFTIDTDSYKREESSDASGNVKGRFSFTNSAGNHDLSFVAGSETGFLPTGGSLSVPNGLGDIGPSGRAGSGAASSPSNAGHSTSAINGAPSSIDSSAGGDGSYSFSYNAGDSQRQESADSSGNVKGRYSYSNSAGNHDLSYIAGSETGFVATGGSLSVPNGLGDIGPSGRAAAGPNPSTGGSSSPSISGPSSSIDSSAGGDGSYSFSYNAGDSQRQESSDASGNVKGRYSYSNSAGNHDLSYIAGSETGFVATGGSLSVPNGLGDIGPSGRAAAGLNPSVGGSSSPSVSGPSSSIDSSAGGDGSYSFSYNTGDSQRQESADSSGNVKGRYSYSNSAGNHDLSYIAGSETGFVATGGSLSVPNGLGDIGPSGRVAAGLNPTAGGSSSPSVSGPSSSIDSSAGGDGSYSFSYNTGDSQRQESSDASGNVKGRYSYSNSAGNHDLSYIAGSETGFVATGGSLSIPNGLGDIGPSGRAAAGIIPSASGSSSSPSSGGPLSIINSSAGGDGSYSFSYNTDDSSRQESSDTSGNVQGKYSYSNSAGNHDLSYIAGSKTGFVATGGSLATPNGLIGKTTGDSPSLKVHTGYLPPVPVAPVLPAPHWAHGPPKANTYNIGKYVVSSYLPPDNAAKFGYIFDTQH